MTFKRFVYFNVLNQKFCNIIKARGGSRPPLPTYGGPYGLLLKMDSEPLQTPKPEAGIEPANAERKTRKR